MQTCNFKLQCKCKLANLQLQTVERLQFINYINNKGETFKNQKISGKFWHIWKFLAKQTNTIKAKYWAVDYNFKLQKFSGIKLKIVQFSLNFWLDWKNMDWIICLNLRRALLIKSEQNWLKVCDQIGENILR